MEENKHFVLEIIGLIYICGAILVEENALIF